MITNGSLVKFSQILEPGDDKWIFVVLEDREERVLVQVVNSNLPFPPVNEYDKSELVEVGNISETK